MRLMHIKNEKFTRAYQYRVCHSVAANSGMAINGDIMNNIHFNLCDTLILYAMMTILIALIYALLLYPTMCIEKISINIYVHTLTC